MAKFCQTQVKKFKDRGTPPFETQCNRFRLKNNNNKQAGTELCQAQSKLIQIGRFLGQIYIFGRIVFFELKFFFDQNKFLGRKKFSG